MFKNLKTTQWACRAIIMLLPLFLSFSWITWIISPACPRYEYAKPDFPPDLGGMSLATVADRGLVPLTSVERLELASVAVAYLESWQTAEKASVMLAEQKLPHTGVPLYNQRELDHLVDVKRITDVIRWLALVTAVPVIGGLAFLLARPQTRRSGYLALGQGGLLTVIVLSGITALILWGWGLFFLQFHGLLFPSGTWTFAETDSLMRLYPERFFFDVGVIMSLGAWLMGVVTTLVGYLLAWRTAVKARDGKQGTHVQKSVQ